MLASFLPVKSTPGDLRRRAIHDSTNKQAGNLPVRSDLRSADPDCLSMADVFQYRRRPRQLRILATYYYRLLRIQLDVIVGIQGDEDFGVVLNLTGQFGTCSHGEGVDVDGYEYVLF